MMKTTTAFLYLISFVFLYHLPCCDPVRAQGIRLTGSSKPIEQRSSIRLFEENRPVFKGILTIAFDLHLKDDGSAGYLLRLKDDGEHPSYNLYFDKEDGQGVFRFNEEGKSSLIRLSVDMDYLRQHRRVPVKLTYDLLKGRIALAVGKVAMEQVKAPVLSSYAPIVHFGKSDYLIDVPSFSIRALRLADHKQQIDFPMRESSGNLVHDGSGVARGTVSKAVWLLNDAYHWQKSAVMQSKSKAGSDYDVRRQLAYYFNRDSLYIYHLRDGRVEAKKFANPCPVLIKLGNSFIDTIADRLYVYETFYEHPYEGPTMASMDLSNHSWRIESTDYPEIELNHHAAHFSPDKQELILFGGFGNMHYTNSLMRYQQTISQWRAPEALSGDQILPRYFTTMGYAESTGKLYVFGGMGNESGDHIVGRKYFYDLYELDPSNGRSKQLWQVAWKEKNFVPGRGLVIPGDDWIYMLGYPEHVSHSLMRLRRFSLREGHYEELGDSIPIYSDKISTRARLYHDQQLQKLVALVQESDDDIRSTLSVYELEFPAISQVQLQAFPAANDQISFWWWIAAAFILLLLLGGMARVKTILKQRRKIAQTDMGSTDLREPDWTSTSSGIEASAQPEQPDKNAIFLFGDFTVLDRKGRDISHLFSTRLRQVFCLIMLHNESAGISSTWLSHLIWPDKPKDKVKTSRGVTINNLRKALADVEGVEIIYESGHYRAAFSPACYCDYIVLRNALSKKWIELPQRVSAVVGRGSFLLGFNDPLFDQRKGELEAELTAQFEQDIAWNEKQEKWTTMYSAAELLLIVDPIHEYGFMKGLKALKQLGTPTRLIPFYQRFAEQYRLALGETYPHSVEDLLAQID